VIDAFLLPVLALVGAVSGPFQQPTFDHESPALFGLTIGIASIIIARWFA
jgi:hypothetical protein